MGEGGALIKEGEATHMPAGARVVVVHTLFGAASRRTLASMAAFFYTESMELRPTSDSLSRSLWHWKEVRHLLGMWSCALLTARSAPCAIRRWRTSRLEHCRSWN